MLRLCTLIPLFCLLGGTPAFAIESETTPVVALRLSKTLENGGSIDATVNASSREGFREHERKIFEIRYGKRSGSNEFMGGYNIQFDRNGSPGSEHRLWQQFRHQFLLDGSSIESSMRIEERYFESTDQHGTRLRMLNRWNRALPHGHLLRLGYEWVFNMEDISRTTQSGVAQNRLIASIQHNFSNGDRLEFEYQMRYLHLVGQQNRLQNQLQLMYVKTL